MAGVSTTGGRHRAADVRVQSDRRRDQARGACDMSSQQAPIYDGRPPDEAQDRIEQVSGTDYSVALSAVDRASIDMQIATAKQYPRSITAALREATELATLDEETAKTMLYALKRGGKVIPGPSVRLAEILAYS